MFNVRAELSIDAPQAAVWGVLDDFGSHHRFNPYIERAEIINDISTGLGAERQIYLYDGSVMRQRILDYHPPRSMTIEVVESQLMVHHSVIEIMVEPEGESGSKLCYRVAYRIPGGILGYPVGLFYKPILLSRYNHVLRGVAQLVKSKENQPDPAR